MGGTLSRQRIGRGSRLPSGVLVALVLLVVALFASLGWAGPSRPAAGHNAQPGAQAGGEVRTGTTEVASPRDTADARRAKQQAYAGPADAPRLSGNKIKVPAPPDSYNTHQAGWIRFAYPPSVRKRVQPLIADADSIRAELSARLGRSVLDEVSVYVARTPGEMATLAPKGASVPKYATGVAYSKIGLILLTIAPLHPNSRHELGEVFRHELAHVALHEAAGGRPVPRWFNEGFAVYASGESSMARLRTLWTASLADNLLPLRQLQRSFPAEAITAELAYAEAADVVRFLVRQQDSQRFGAMIQRIRRGQSFERALQDAYGTDLGTLEYEWREDVKKRYTYWPVLFSGGVVWVGIIGLIAWVWRRRRRRSRATLERWTHEEAVADALRRKIRTAEEDRRVHIVVARNNQPAPPDLSGRFPEPEVPKVEHKGHWHTLH